MSLYCVEIVSLRHFLLKETFHNVCELLSDWTFLLNFNLLVNNLVFDLLRSISVKGKLVKLHAV